MTPVPFFEKRRNGHVGICLCYEYIVYIVYAFAAAGTLLRRLLRRLGGAGEIPEPGPSHPHDPQCPFLRSAEYWARRDLPVLYIVYASTDTRPCMRLAVPNPNSKAKASRFAAARRNGGTPVGIREAFAPPGIGTRPVFGVLRENLCEKRKTRHFSESPQWKVLFSGRK